MEPKKLPVSKALFAFVAKGKMGIGTHNPKAIWGEGKGVLTVEVL